MIVVFFVADREVQRILLELLNQMDGFDQNVNVKVRFFFFAFLLRLHMSVNCGSDDSCITYLHRITDSFNVFGV